MAITERKDKERFPGLSVEEERKGVVIRVTGDTTVQELLQYLHKDDLVVFNLSVYDSLMDADKYKCYGHFVYVPVEIGSKE